VAADGYKSVVGGSKAAADGYEAAAQEGRNAREAAADASVVSFPRHGWRFFSHPWVDVDWTATHSDTRIAKCKFSVAQGTPPPRGS
jgi:hypothetical protein